MSDHILSKTINIIDNFVIRIYYVCFALSNFWLNSGIKCGDCGSYNTVRDKGPLKRIPRGNAVAATSFEVDDGGTGTSPGTLTPPEQDGEAVSGRLTPPETPDRNQMSDPMALGMF